MATDAANKVDYIEFQAADIAATKKFFEQLFGWKFTDYGPDYTSFHDGRINGGFFAAPGAPAKTNPMVVVFATNLEEAEARVKKAGGTIVKPSFEFPGGRRFQFTDPNGLELA